MSSPIVLLIVVLATVANVHSQCVIRDECDTKSNLLGDVQVPCHDVHDPIPLNDSDAFQILTRICPDLFLSSEDPTILDIKNDDDHNFCCDPGQVYEMETNFRMPMQVGLGSCASCAYNWRANFCQMTCSPVQATFVTVTNSTPVQDGKRRVESIDYHVSDQYANGLFSSCKDVKGIIPRTMMLDMMCGDHQHAGCDAVRWLEFLGMPVELDGQSPFKINYVIHGATIVADGNDGNSTAATIAPMDVRTIPCDQSPPGGKNSTCDCYDCPSSCPKKN